MSIGLLKGNPFGLLRWFDAVTLPLPMSTALLWTRGLPLQMLASVLCCDGTAMGAVFVD